MVDSTSVRGNYLHRLSTLSKTYLENFFYRWGFTVATHPGKFITICVLVTIIFGSGLILIKEETRPDKLILPADAEYAVNTAWIREKGPIPFRPNYAGIGAINVLTPEVMKILIDIHETVKSITTPSGKKWDDVCFKVPITKIDLGQVIERRRRDAKEENDEEQNTTTTPKLRAYSPVSNSSLESSDENSVGDFDDDFFKDSQETEDDEQTHKQWAIYHSMSENVYCSVLEVLDDACLEFNPVEFWSYDRSKIESLTQEEVIRVFNHEIISPVVGRRMNYKAELGGKIERNDKGEIISAESLLMMWNVYVDPTKELITDSQGLVGDKDGLEWENAWITAMKKFAKELVPSRGSEIKVYFANASCWGDILDETLIREGIILVCGFGIMSVYVLIMLSRMNKVEQRPFLTFAGLISIAFALIASCGACVFLSIPFMTLNRVMPFLILGLGIDDMFVIMQCLNNLHGNQPKNKKLAPLPERIGLTLKHAGCSITVTSLTDICCFLAGSVTIIPSLRSFCIYSAAGIAVLFLFQCTLFVACLAIDQKRLEENRNAYFWWIKYDKKDFVRNEDPTKGHVQNFFDKILSKYLLTKIGKVTVIITTGVFLAFGIYGNVQLRQHSDAMWFIPEDSYLVQFFRMHKINYPDKGWPGLLVAHQMNWTESLPVFGSLLEDLQDSPYTHDIMQFYTVFKVFVKDVYEIDMNDQKIDPQKIPEYMGKFLYSPYGAKFKYFFKLNGTFSCGDSLPPIETVIVPFHFNAFPETTEIHVTAMNTIKAMVKNVSEEVTFNNYAGDEGKLFFWAQISIAWEVDEIVKGEMYKNIFLSMSCVMLAILLLLANFKMCLMCGICVVFTVINVSGFMHYVGLTIDSVACTILVLAVGLCVDYAAHICLAFMESRKESKTARAADALRVIGPAVFNGGFSTFLGVILLINALTVAAFSFFKIFTLVVVFGLFHGLCFLPVILSVFGSELSDLELEERKEKDERSSCPKLLEMQSMSGGNEGKGRKEETALSLGIDGDPHEELLPVHNNNKIRIVSPTEDKD